MRRLVGNVVAGAAILTLCLVLGGVGRPELAIGLLGCVAFVLGAQHLADVMLDALPARPSAAVVAALVTVGMVALAIANPGVWPLFVLGCPSCACIVVEAWLQASEKVSHRLGARKAGKAQMQVQTGNVPQPTEKVRPHIATL